MQNAPIKTADVTQVTLAKKMLQKTSQIPATVIVAKITIHPVIVNVAKTASATQNLLAHVNVKTAPAKTVNVKQKKVH
jgi:hypothetical protein